MSVNSYNGHKEETLYCEDGEPPEQEKMWMSHPLEVFKARMDQGLLNLDQWKVSLPMAGALELNDLKVIGHCGVTDSG